MFRESPDFKPVEPVEKSDPPENNYSTPGLLGQMRIFFTRDVISKLANRQYVLLSLLEPPVLALFLAVALLAATVCLGEYRTWSPALATALTKAPRMAGFASNVVAGGVTVSMRPPLRGVSLPL